MKSFQKSPEPIIFNYNKFTSAIFPQTNVAEDA